MVISHKYKYIFIGLPFRASKAISKELCENYDGESLFEQHSLYHNFIKVASEEERKYKIVACVRNPMDIVVSFYLRLKSNVGGKFTHPQYFARNGGNIPNKALENFYFIQTNNADFDKYFKRYFKIPYDDFASIALSKCDYIIRFEYLNDDFKAFLHSMEIELIRDLTKINVTSESAKIKKENFLSYYGEEIEIRANYVFLPYIYKYGVD